uniref:Uncharacterized protein n=1 Tax=Eutreptiella gymnastica TaxID=73025 RepID=A0A6U8LQ19_9EUGL|mmetsp:Transcript_78308/g.138296  ORF Transcript_78308/g.138296 Transcript_78308/m.138296 type:complete len:729 (+) Transcript_78308:44-2230(+)
MPPLDQQIVGDFRKFDISISRAQQDEDFQNRVANPSVAAPVLDLICKRYSSDVAQGPLNITPRLFLSAYLVIGTGFLDHHDPKDAELYAVALRLLSAFETLCRLLELDEARDVQEALQAFARSYRDYAPKFVAWKQVDRQRLIDRYIATYLEVERAHEANRLGDVSKDVPAFCQEIRRQLQQVGGQAALDQLDAERSQPQPPTEAMAPAPATAQADPTSVATPLATATESTRQPILQKIGYEDQTPVPQVPPAPEPPGQARPSLSDQQVQQLREAYAKAKLAHGSVCGFAAAAATPKPNEPRSTNDQLRAIAERAFWDVLREEVSMDPPNYMRLGVLINEATDILSSCLPRDSHFKKELQNTLDWEVLQKTLSPELLKNFVCFVMGKVLELEAPVHNKATNEATQKMCEALDGDFHPGLVVDAFKFVIDKLRNLQEEVDGFRRKMAMLQLKPQAVPLQKEYVALAITLEQWSFARTQEWLTGVMAKQDPAQLQALLRAHGHAAVVVRTGLLELLQSKQAANAFTVPETFSFDVANIVHLQNRVQHVTLIACLVNIGVMLCQQKRLSLSQQEIRVLKERLDSALVGEAPTLALISASLADFLAECMATPSRASQGLSAWSPQDGELVTSMVAKTTNAEDPVFTAFQGKIVAALGQFCQTDAPKTVEEKPLFTSVTLQIVQGDVWAMGKQLWQLFLNNTAVFAQHYHRMVQEAAGRLEAGARPAAVDMDH